MSSIQIDRNDGLSSSTAVKGPCRVATTANIALYGLQTIDGVALVAGDRVLVKDQMATYENGIYVSDTGQWRRAKDFNRNDDVRQGTQLLAAEGVVYELSLWCVTSGNPVVIGTDPIVFAQTIISTSELQALVDAANAAAAAAAVSEAAAEAAAAAAQAAVPNAFPLTRTVMKAYPTTITSAYLKEAGREGQFVLRTGSPPISDAQEGIYVISNTAGFYWERIYAPARYPSVYVFGALGGTNNDSVAVQASLNVIGFAYLPYRANGWTFGNITLTDNQRIIGERGTVVKATALVGGYVVRYVTSITTAGVYGGIEDITFDGAAADVNSTCIRFGMSSGIIFGFRGSRINIKNFGEAIGDEAHATNFLVDVYFQDVYCFLTRARQVYLRRSRGFMTFRDFKIDHTYNSSAVPVTWEGARFEDVIGLELEKFDVVGPVTGAAVYQAGAVGLIIVGAVGSASVWLRRVLIDNTRGPGVSLNNIFNVFAIDLCIFQNLGPALGLSSVTKSQFTNTKIVGGVGLAGTPASATGVSMVSCSDVIFTNLEVEANTGDGVSLTSCTDCKILGGYSKGNAGYGYKEITAATRNLRSGVSAILNSTGSLLQLGAQSATVDWYGNGGTFRSSDAGAITVV